MARGGYRGGGGGGGDRVCSFFQQGRCKFGGMIPLQPWNRPSLPVTLIPLTLTTANCRFDHPGFEDAQSLQHNDRRGAVDSCKSNPTEGPSLAQLVKCLALLLKGLLQTSLHTSLYPETQLLKTRPDPLLLRYQTKHDH